MGERVSHDEAEAALPRWGSGLLRRYIEQQRAREARIAELEASRADIIDAFYRMARQANAHGPVDDSLIMAAVRLKEAP